MQIFTYLEEVYGFDKVYYETVRIQRKKFPTSTESFKDAAKSGRRPVTVLGKAKDDNGCTLRDIYKAVCTKHGRRPVVAKRTTSTKMDLYCIFLSCNGIDVHIPVPQGKSVTNIFLMSIIKNVNQINHAQKTPI